LGGRLLVAVGAVVASGVIAGVSSWLGAATQQSAVGFASLLSAGLNTVPPAIFVLGIGALAIGVWPRGTSVAVYGVLVWSLLLEFAGGFATLSHWLLDTSVFHHMASAPAVSPRWGAAAVMVVLGFMAMVTGTVAFSRRDLQGE
jgi:ABC-2 type transport system permease protein